MVGEIILHYKIIEKLGQGGMGEVYKALDIKLERFVALKFLSSELIANDIQKARFSQEAKAASTMNHPNVCTIYEVQEFDKRLFIAMEFIDGRTLREKKNLSEKQMLDVGIQVAEGLAAAHEKGIVHRDIKPENIMIRQDGIVQIMDFGLAKHYDSGDINRLTKSGTIMGTTRYMSPEQIQGFDVDYRTDIFSLGIVLYELFTGEFPFKGVYETAIMHEIVNISPRPLSAIKRDIDTRLNEIILECLQKDKDERCQSAKELAKNLRKVKGSSGENKTGSNKVNLLLKDTENESDSSVRYQSKISSYIHKNRINLFLFFLLISLLLILYNSLWHGSHVTFTQPVHFSFNIPGSSNPILTGGHIVRISPNGKLIAYVDMSMPTILIYLRKLDNPVPFAVPGTENGYNPIFENDKWLLFEKNSFINKVPLTGGVPVNSQYEYDIDFCTGTNGEIVAVKNWTSGLIFQSNWNDKQTILTRIDYKNNEGAHLTPQVLPDNRAALFTVWSKDGTFDNSKIALVNLKTKERKILNYNGIDLLGTSPQFIQVPWGNYIIWVKYSNLYAALFDLDGLEVVGPEIKILDGIATSSLSGKAAYSVSDGNNGSIAYIPGKLDISKFSMIWYNKNGIEKKAIEDNGPYLAPMLTKDNRAIVILAGPVFKIGMIDFNKNKIEPLFYQGDNIQAKISPDGTNFIFVSNFENGKYNIYMKRLDGVGPVKKIASTEGGYPEISNLSHDGRYILYNLNYGNYEGKIWIKDIKSNQKPSLLINTESNVTSPEFSPDGKLLAYRSDEIDETYKLFIRPFPINDLKVQLSIDDGFFPQWSADGKEIYYQSYSEIIAAKIQRGKELKVLSRRTVYKTELAYYEFFMPDFSVAPDGRILVLKNIIDKSKPVKVNVIVNWFTELKGRLTE